MKKSTFFTIAGVFVLSLIVAVIFTGTQSTKMKKTSAGGDKPKIVWSKSKVKSFKKSKTLPKHAKNAREAKIKDSFTVTLLKPSKFAAFKSSVEALGGKIVASNPKHGLYKIRLDGLKTSDLILDWGRDLRISPNYRVTLPPTEVALGNARKMDGLAVDSSAKNKTLEMLLNLKGVNRSDWGAGITVAVLDTGVMEHSGVPVKNDMDLLPLGALEGPGAGHGLAVASLISGKANLVQGFSGGLAPGADLLSIRVLDAEGAGDSFSMANGIYEAVEKGAKIINISAGTPGDSPDLREAVNYAFANGVLVVAAAGNDGVDQASYPAAYLTAISVSASDNSNNPAAFSNLDQANLSLAAPGQQLIVAGTEDDYTVASGTSISSPIVAGSIAALWSKYPDLPMTEIRKLVYENVDYNVPRFADEKTQLVSLAPDRMMKVGGLTGSDAAVGGVRYDKVNDKLLVTVQNRGTEDLENMHVVVMIKGKKSESTFKTVNAGQFASLSANLKGLDSLDFVTVYVKSDNEDSNPKNNLKEFKFSPERKAE